MRKVALYGSALLLVVSTSAHAALSKEYADFAKGPAQHLLTTEERAQWKNIKTDEAAREFIELFWARRDPSPGTAVNENRDLFDQRVKVADGNFREPKKIGSLTDRGKAFILMGTPTKIVRSNTGPTSTIQQPDQVELGTPQGNTTVQGYSPKEVWVFEQAKVAYTLGQPIAELAFIDQYGSNDWKMDKVITTDPKSLFDKVAKNFWLTQPNLTQVPEYTAAAATQPAAPVSLTAAPAPAAPAGPTAFTVDTLRAAVDAAREKKATSDALFVTHGEFVTAEGEHFVPVALYVPKSAGLTAGPGLTFFGSITNEAGEEVKIYEEPATLVASNDDLVFAKSLELAPGKYTGVFGLARDGQPVSVVAKPLTVTGLDKAAPGVSHLILSGNVFPMAEAQAPTEPFAFGGLKVVPRGNLVFRQTEDLWYFVEVRNPGLPAPAAPAAAAAPVAITADATAAAAPAAEAAPVVPKLSMKVTIEGKTTEGKPVKIAGPAEVVQPIELKGVAGHWGVGQAIPLATIKPGTYTMNVKLTDMTLAKTYELSETFSIIP